MVSLYKFYETDSAIHFLLQHATGGKLWNYIGAYLHGRSEGKNKYDNDAAQFGNVYAGTKLHEHDNSSHVSENNIADVGKNAQTSSNNVLIRYLNTDGNEEVKIGSDSERKVTEDFDQSDCEAKKDYDRLESFSSAEEGSETNDFKPSSVEQKDFVFQELLQDSKSKLEQFSINSSDSISSDCRTRVDSFVFDKSDVIHEENEGSPLEALGEALTAELDNVFANENVNKSGDDSEKIVQSARELLRSVERTLSQTDAEVEKMLSSKENGSSIGESSQINKGAGGKHLISETVMSGNSSATVIDDSDSNEVSIYDINRSSSSTDTNDSDKCHKSNDAKGQDVVPLTPNCDISDSDLKVSRTDTLIASDQNSPQCSQSSDSPQESKKSSRSSTLTENSAIKKNLPPAKLTLTRMNSKELSRSWSMERELTSPPRSRQRTVSDVFKEMEVATPDQVKLPESCIKQWMAEIVVALAKLHAEGIVCRYSNAL